ncbi:MAG: hypothetical protein ACREQ9_21725, partial [Candidatus Binatia bacterium]
IMNCNGSGGSGPGTSQTELDEEEASQAPASGQFLADCQEDGTAVIDEFVAGLGIELPEELPTAEEVFASGDPNDVPVVGGLVPDALDPDALESVSAEDAEEMLPAGGLPVDLPIVGLAQVSCSDAPISLEDPEHAIGTVPVFDEDGDPVGLVLLTVEDVAGTGPAVDDVSLDDELDALPEPFASTIATILALLSGLPLT